MTFFEALAAASVALGLAIPVFLEKVMRPKYEERFEEFRLDNRATFVLALEKALEKLRRLKRSHEAMSAEVYTTMEELFSQWGQLRTGENKLASLLARRKPLFVAWMMSFAASLAGLRYSEALVTPTFTMGDVATSLFFLTLAYSVIYVLELFDLDTKLSKYSGSMRSQIEERPALSTESAKDDYSRVLDGLEQKLGEANISFEREPRLKGPRRPDLAIPSAKDPVAFIEVKSGNISRAISYPIAYMGQELKKAYPSARTILIIPNPTDGRLHPLRSGWDFVIGNTDVARIIEIVSGLLTKSVVKR
jgi:hypothetical protein